MLVAMVLPGSTHAQDIELTKISSYDTGIFDGSAAEISAYDPLSQRVFFTNSETSTVEVLDISNPFAPVFLFSIDLTPYGSGPTSVGVFNGLVAIAVPADPETDPGSVVFFDTEGTFQTQVTVGALPDMLTFTPDGSYVAVANEGQPSDDYAIDPEGSVSLINTTTFAAMTIGFTDFNEGGSREAELPTGVRIFGPGASVAQDLEPEYITISPDGTTAYVTLQENNALAVIDIAGGTVSAIVDLGSKDHSLEENAFDASNRDGMINITTWPVLGMYQPDAIASYEVNGNVFLVTANEGDARDYDTFSEEARVADLMLDPTAYPNAEMLQMEENLGRLNSTTATGDTDGDGDIDQIFAYGARSFTIWSSSGVPVYDSGSFIEDKLAELIPDNFNSTNDENDTFDNRSDDKGPEPEAVEIATIDGTPYAFIGLERVGGIMVFDITNPAAPTFVTYNNARDFDVLFDPDTITQDELAQAGDLGPEGIVFVPSTDSPNGMDLLIVSNEVSGNVSIFEVGAPRTNEAVTLTVLHNNDGESQLLFAPGQEDFGGAARFKTLMDQLRADADLSGAVITLSSGDNFLAGPEFQVSLNQPEGEQLFESRVLDLIGYDALAIGNHEFDFGPDVLERLIRDFESPTPFLSANLDFSNEAGLSQLEQAGRIAASTVVEKDGQLFGIVGATTPNLPFVSSPRDVIVIDDVASEVQAEINALEAAGVNKIILINHLQGIEEDQALIGMLSGVDIAIAGGGDELLANEGDLLVPGDEEEVFDEYPLLATAMDGNTVPVVTTAGNYKYIGRLIVDFDENGEVTDFDTESGPVRVSGIEADAVEEDQTVVDEVTSNVQAALDGLANNIIATSEVALDGVRGNIRSTETNLGNLIADAYLWQAEQLAGDFGIDVPQVAFANGGGIRNDNVIPAGDISELTTFDILPFANFLTVVPDVPAQQFLEILENAYSRVGGSSGTGRFAQVGGISLIYDPAATAQVITDGVVTTPGERIRRAVLSDGTVVVNNGELVDPEMTIDVVSVDFLVANDGDQYPFRGAPFTSLGVTYQQTLSNYIIDGLGGTITAAAYPEGGEGRITAIGENAEIQLTVLHNNDGESQLLFAPGQEDFGGAARFKTLLDQLRSDADAEGAVVTLSSGDNFLAGPEFQVSLNQPEGEQLFESRVLELLGYDALAIGNHEFDFGPDVLERLISDFQAPTPFLSANLDFSNEAGLNALVEAGRIAKSTYVVKDGQLIGIVGATTPNLPFVSSPRDVIVMSDVAAAVQAEIDAFEAMGVNKIILISHLQGVQEDQDLIGMLSGVDIAIAGGGDELLANEGDLLVPGDEEEVVDVYPLIATDVDGTEVPVVTTAGNYKYIGRLIVDFDADGNVTMISDESGPVRVSGIEADAVEEDQTVVDDVTSNVQAALDGLANNIIATSEVALDGVRSNIRGVETNLGNLIADAYLWQAEQLAGDFGIDVPQVAFANGGGIRNDNVIPAGDISELTTFDILPFANFLTVVPDVPAQQFLEILENAYSRVGGSSGTGRFAQVGGISIIYDPSATAMVIDDNGVVTTQGERIRRAVLSDGTVVVNNGELVDPEMTIDVVSVDFLVANDGDQYPFRGAAFTSLGVTYQQTLSNYITEGLSGTITAAAYPEGGEGRITPIGENADIQLTVLHNNDGESQLLFAPGQEDFGGAARFKTLMDQLRTDADENGAVVTLSSGDNFLAGPEFQVSLNQPEDEQLFESRVLELIGYDALAIGNHEFDFGPDVLERLISNFNAPTPFLSANLDFSNEEGLNALVEAGRIAKSTYVVKDGQLIGIIGATTPNLPFVSSPRDVIVMDDVAAAVQAEIDAFEAMGVNKIILISHLQGVEEDQELIGMLSGIDIAIAGGGDELLANEGDLLVPGDEGEVFGEYPLIAMDMSGTEVPVVTSAGNYKYIGRLIVDFDADGNVTMISDESGPVRVSGIEADAVEEDQTVVDDVTSNVQAALDGLANNILASSEVALDGVRGNIRSVETNLGNLITDAFIWNATQLADDFGTAVPDVAIANGGGIRNDNVIPAGDISELTTFDILPFANFLVVLEDIPAEQFKEILENAVSAIGGSSGTGRFAQLSGVTLRYDPMATAQVLDDDENVTTPGERVITAVLDDGRVIVEDGAVVDASATVTIVTVNFLATGGDQYPYRGAAFTSLGVTYQQALANFITDGLGGTIAAAAYPEGGEGRVLTVEQAVSVQDPIDELPREYALHGNYPNPFNPTTTISFSLPEAAEVQLAIYDLLGRQMHVLVSNQMTAGVHEVQFAADNLPSGTYFYRLTTPEGEFVKQMVLLK